MKKKQSIINFSLMIAVLFSILFQSFHSYEHLAKQLSQELCHHKYNLHKTEFTHQHHNFDSCFVCDFTLSSFVSAETFLYTLQFAHTEIPHFFTANETPKRFSGSSYLLRGPPNFIV